MSFISAITTCWGRRERVQVGESDRCAALHVRMFVVDMIGGLRSCHIVLLEGGAIDVGMYSMPKPKN